MLTDKTVARQMDATGKAVIIPLGADSPSAWLTALEVLYAAGSALAPSNVAAAAEIGDKYDIAALRTAIDEWIAARATETGCAGYRPGINVPGGQVHPLWDMLVLAGRCRLPKALDACCSYIIDNRMEVPEGLDLGPAAQPLAVRLAKKNNDYRLPFYSYEYEGYY